MSLKLYTPCNWFDIERLCADDVEYHETKDLLVDYDSYAKLQAENEALKAKLFKINWLLSTASAEDNATKLFDDLDEILDDKND